MKRKYIVTCFSCDEKDEVLIDEESHQIWDFGRKLETNILSMRWRSDLVWGIECRCGNDNRLAPSEEKEFKRLVSGDPMSVKRITESLKIPDKKQFSLRAL